MMQRIDIGCADYELALDAIATYISIADKIRNPILQLGKLMRRTGRAAPPSALFSFAASN
jgi:hypothetical protein